MTLIVNDGIKGQPQQEGQYIGGGHNISRGGQLLFGKGVHPVC